MSGVSAGKPVRVDKGESHGGTVNSIRRGLVCRLAWEAMGLGEEKGEFERLGFGGPRFLRDGATGVEACTVDGGGECR